MYWVDLTRDWLETIVSLNPDVDAAEKLVRMLRQKLARQEASVAETKAQLAGAEKVVFQYKGGK